MNGRPAIATDELTKRYGSTWALRGCTLAVPTGSVVALVGPNGAGKTTLLQLALGLITPSSGTVEVLGCEPRADAKHVLPRVGFVAQDHPLYRGLTLEETLGLGRRLNPSFDDHFARTRVAQLGLPLGRKVGRLSGGQQTQVALTLALAKRPELLVLDEPAASLDPLARHEFLGSLMEAAAERELTIVLSSHIIGDLERTCDHLVILQDGAVVLEDPIERVLATHRLLTGPRSDPSALRRSTSVVAETHTERQSTILVRAEGHVYDASWRIERVELEEIVLAYLGRRDTPGSSLLPLERAS